MASTDVVVRFVSDTTQLRGDLAKVQGTGAKLKGWAKGVGAAIGGAFVVKTVADMVTAASDLNETMNKTNVVFGQNARTVVAWSETAAEAMGLSQQEALDAASGFGTMFQQLGVGAEAGQKMSLSMVQASSDIASFYNVAGGAAEVTDMMAAAFRGEYDSLQRVVPAINAAAVEQKALATTGKTSAKALTQGEKAAATYALILEGMGPAAGDFAETSDSMANSTRIASAQWKDAQAKLGQALLPTVTKITQALAKLGEWMSQNTSVVYAFAVAVGVLGVAVLIATYPVAAIVLGIAALAAGLVWAYQNVEIFRTIMQTAFQVLTVVFQVWWTYVSTVFKLYIGAWKLIWTAMRVVFNWLKQNWPLVAAILAGPIGIATLLVIRNFDKVKAVVQAAFGFIKAIWAGIYRVLTWPIEQAVRAIQGIINGIKTAISGAFAIVRDLTGKITGFVTDVVAKARGVGTSIANLLKRPINALIRGWNDIHINLPKVSTPFGDIGGGRVDFPNIPELQRGGLVTSTGLAMVHRGEMFSGVGNTIGGSTFNINIEVRPGTDPAQTGRAVVDLIRAYERANGRKVLAS
jgi:hypothetical protein